MHFGCSRPDGTQQPLESGGIVAVAVAAVGGLFFL